MKRRIQSSLAAWVCTLGLLSACGGGGGASTANAPINLNSTLASGVSDVATPLYNALEVPGAPPLGSLTPLADQVSPDSGGSGAGKVYTPSQIRAAYRMPTLPTNWTQLNDKQRADMGAGQTIYIVVAFDAPNIKTELDAFNTQFKLPACSAITLDPASTVLPIPAAGVNGCQFAKVYASANNGLASNAPVANTSWAREAALDVQWAHATAPLARIILVEAADDSMTSMLTAINLANAMGPGVVSMSFGVPEGSGFAAYEPAFGVANMSYVAASGDSGAGTAQWPSVSPKVLGVGGTTLSGYNAITRNESTWTGSGGGQSTNFSAPAYQNSSVPGLGTITQRSVADVAFNADPYTGQYVASMAPGSNRLVWYSMGGTSIGAPQWAGLIAVARAHRARLNLSAMSDFNTPLYTQAANVGLYSGNNSSFLDITSGSSGPYSAGTGYDAPTGLGTPNVSGLISLLAPETVSPPAGGRGTAPVVSAVTQTGTAGTALSFSVSVTSANSVTWSIAGAPSGMTINSATGLVSWPNPVAGTTQITVTATDTLNGLSGSGTVTLSIAAPQTPGTVSTHTKTVAGNAGVPLLIGVPGLRFNVESYTLDSIKLPDGGTVIPSDLTVNPMLGWIQWNNPVQGKTTLTLTARDAAQKAVVSWVITLNINGPLVGPTISTTPITGNVGTALRSLVRISANPNDANVYLIDISVTGAPAGMRLYGTSQGLAVKWANPVAGTYVLGITATDDTPNHGGKSTQANVTLTIQ